MLFFSSQMFQNWLPIFWLHVPWGVGWQKCSSLNSWTNSSSPENYDIEVVRSLSKQMQRVALSSVWQRVMRWYFLLHRDKFYQTVMITFLFESVMTMPWSKVLTCCFTIVYTVQNHWLYDIIHYCDYNLFISNF